MGNKLVVEDRNSALCYLPFLGWMPALVLLFIDKDPVVRRNAVQSIMGHGLVAGFYWVAMPLINATIILRPMGGVLSGLVGASFFVLSLVAVTTANAGGKVVWPILSEWTDKVLKNK
jgi:uncharacterized membrane protein